MSDIVLTALNSRYYHCAASLVFLKANLGPYEDRATIREFVIKQETAVIADELIGLNPKILMISVYIWNVTQTRALVQRIKAIAPDICIVLGGPEVSYAPQDPVLMDVADFVVSGEGELVARELLDDLFNDRRPATKMITGRDIGMDELRLPYYLYTDEDVANRIVYVETSRGCPYKCEYCLSSLDNNVRFIPLEVLFPELEILIDRGVKLFKLLDRTFNTKIQRAVDILQFFLDRFTPGMQLHMEFIPDRLPDPLKEIITKFPPDALQFEIGVQSYNQEILDRIKRRQKCDVVHENIRWFIAQSHAVVHADLIIGLPGETEESFAHGFNELVQLYPQHIQINLLKLLKGTPIVHHTEPFGMVYDKESPFEIQQNSTIPPERMIKLKHLSRFWTLFHNQERFRKTLPLIWQGAVPYDRFMAFCDFVYARFERGHGISLYEQARVLFDFLVEEVDIPPEQVAPLLIDDYGADGKRLIPKFLKTAIVS